MELRRVVVVGASLAGLRAAEQLRADGFDGELTVVGAESCMPYDRPPLSKGVLSGASSEQDVELRGATELVAEWRLGTTATDLDLDRRTIGLSGGERLRFDGLVIATGAGSRTLPAVPMDLPGVVGLRTLDDAMDLRRRLADRPHVGVIGAGFIGTEVASSCRDLGLDVTLISTEPPLLRGLGPLHTFSSRVLADAGVAVRVGPGVAGVRGSGRVERVDLTDGTGIDVDVLVVAVGARPTTDWLEGSGLRIADGVVCDEWCAATGVEGVVAAGDVARWPVHGRLRRLEHWTNAVEQAVAAARTLLHGRDTPYAPVPYFWSDQFGLRLQGIGDPGSADRAEIASGAPDERRFVATLHRGSTLVGAVACNDPRGLVARRRQMLAGAAA